MSTINKIKEKALRENIPIIQDDGILFIERYIKENNIKNILEIGSAVGYSAIRMALCASDIKVTTIEKDDERYKEAVQNISNMNLKKRITIINTDALNIELDSKYDLIFIDAAKSKNIEFFKKFAPLLENHGIVVTDNLSFHGLVEDPSLIKTKNQKGIVRHIKEYTDYLNNLTDYKTVFYSLGDGLAVTKKVHDE